MTDSAIDIAASDIAGRSLALCVVGPLPPPAGGMANQCQQLAALLRAEGMSVEVVRNNADYRPRWVGRIPVLRAAFRLVPYLARLWFAVGRANVVHVLANSGLAWHLFAAPAVWIARARGVPVIVNYRGGNAERFLAGTRGIVLATLRMASARVTPSAFLQGVFAKHSLDALVVPNIVDLSRFSPVAPRTLGDAPHLLVARHLEAIYDVATALRAFAVVRRQLREARLTIAGSGPEKARLEALAAELGLTAAVRFAGPIDNADMPELLRSADCMLNASTIDNMPVSILEAHASGVPVISTDAGGIRDMVHHGTSALLVPVGDAAAMAAQALRVLTEPELRARLRTGGLERSERYAWSRVREQWLHVYRGVRHGTR
jgi:glycosyltransferase involved in cell wall biosynthesis